MLHRGLSHRKLCSNFSVIDIDEDLLKWVVRSMPRWKRRIESIARCSGLYLVMNRSQSPSAGILT